MSSEVTNLLEQLSKGSDQQPDLAKAVDQLEAIMKEAQVRGTCIRVHSNVRFEGSESGPQHGQMFGVSVERGGCRGV